MSDPTDLASLAAVCHDAIAEHRYDDSPNEAVGLIWPDGTIYRLVNEDEDPTAAYRVNRARIATAIATNPHPPVALYHTHAGLATPSLADSRMLGHLAAAGNDTPTMFIFGSDGLRAWQWHDGAIKEHDLGKTIP